MDGIIIYRNAGIKSSFTRDDPPLILSMSITKQSHGFSEYVEKRFSQNSYSPEFTEIFLIGLAYAFTDRHGLYFR